jgi:hypothetical protein
MLLQPLLLAAMTLSVAAASAGELAEIHRRGTNQTSGPPIYFQSLLERASTNHGVTEIGLERTPCHGTCPSYTFVVKSDGTFRYQGQRHAERQGSYTGTIAPGRFHQLARFILDSGFEQLPDNHSVAATDLPTTFTLVTIHGQQKTVRNYGGAGPTKLWAIEQLIEALMVKAKWDAPPTPPTTELPGAGRAPSNPVTQRNPASPRTTSP